MHVAGELRIAYTSYNHEDLNFCEDVRAIVMKNVEKLWEFFMVVTKNVEKSREFFMVVIAKGWLCKIKEEQMVRM